MNNEKLLLRYLSALESGDVETMARLLQLAQHNETLSRQIRELHEAFEADVSMNGFHEGEKIMQLSIPLDIRPQTRQRSNSVLLSMIAAVVTLFFVGIVLAVQPISNDSQPATPPFSLNNLQPITPENVDDLTPLITLGNGAVYSVAWSPDGETMAVASTKGIYLHDADDLTAEPTLLNSSIEVWMLDYSGDGARLVAQGWNSLSVLDAETGAVIRELTLEEHLQIYETFINIDGSQVAARLCVQEPDAAVRGTCGQDALYVWDVESGELVNTLTLSQRANMSPIIALNPEMTTLVYTNAQSVYLMNVESGELLQSDISLEGANVSAMNFNTDGSKVAFAIDNVDRRIRVYDVSELLENASPVNTTPPPASRPINFVSGIVGMVFRPNDQQVLGVERDGGYVVYDIERDEIIQREETAGEWVNYFFANSTAEQFATVNDIVQIWNTEDGSEIALLDDFYNHPYNYLTFSGDGSTLAASGWESGIDYWDLTASSPERQQFVREVEGKFTGVTYPVLNEDGSKVAYHVQSRRLDVNDLEVYDLQSDELVTKTSSNQINSVQNLPVFLEDDSLLWLFRRFVITQTRPDGSSISRELNVDTRPPTDTFIRNTLSPDGRFIAMALCIEDPASLSVSYMCSNYEVGVWDAMEGTRLSELAQIQAPLGWAGEFTFSNDGQTLAMSYCPDQIVESYESGTWYDCGEYEIRLWDLSPLYNGLNGESEQSNTQTEIASVTMNGENYPPGSISISLKQDRGVLLATAGEDGAKAYQVDFESNEVLPVFELTDLPFYEAALFNQQNTMLAVSDGGQITLYGIRQ